MEVAVATILITACLTYLMLVLVAPIMSVLDLAYIFTVVGGIVATLLLIRPMINAVKWLLPPRLDVDFAEYSEGCIKRDNPREIEVAPNKPIEVGVRILPKWTYRLRIIEVLGHGLKIKETRIFTKKLRGWMKDHYTDLHGDFKVLLHDFVVMEGGISSPTLVDVKIDPIRKGKRKNISVRIETEESRKLFTKDLWLSA